MFWNIFLELCNKVSKSPNAIAKELSIPSGSITAWKKGSVPQDRTISKIANYFGVPVEYLLGKTDNKFTDEKSPSDNGEGNITKKHMQILDAYDRSQPAIQYAVDKLLGIEEKPQTFKVKIAARNGEFIEKEMTKEEIDAIKNLPDLDGDL